MNEQHGHLTAAGMQDFLAGCLEGAHLEAARRHLAECRRCSRRLQTYAAIDHALRTMPLERADGAFTERVLERAGVAPRKAYRFADVMAGMMAAVFVGGVLLVVFGMMGIIPVKTAIGDSSAAASWWNDLSRYLSGLLGTLSVRVEIPSVSISSVMLGALSLAVIVVLLGLDHIVERWIARGNGAR